MSRNCKIRIDETEIEVFLSTKAMIDIKDEMQKPFESLKEWLIGEEGESLDVTEQLYRIAHVIGRLANGAVFKHNSLIKSGLRSGELKEFYTLETFVNILDPFQMEYYFKAIFECINLGTVVSVPENVKFDEEDEVLREMDEEKNQKAGDAETTAG